MAYSTRKDFFSVPSVEENVACECKETCVKFKTYASATDGRSWATSDAKQSRYFSELVTCQCPTDPGEAAEGASGSNRQPRGSKQNDDANRQRNSVESSREQPRGSKENGSLADYAKQQRNSVESSGEQPRGSKQNETLADYAKPQRNSVDSSAEQPRGSRQYESLADYAKQQRDSVDSSQDQPRGSKQNETLFLDAKPQRNSVESSTGTSTSEVGDSVLDCLVKQFSDIEKLLGENKELRAQLELTREQLQVSDERLHTANMESGQLKSILYEKFDNYRTRDFMARLPELTAKGEISQEVADELIDLYHTCEVLRAENANFKVLIEMLYQRGRMDDVEVDDETSTDVEYLQAEVKRLRQEVVHLRQYEDAKLQIMSTSTIHVGDKYVNALKEVMRQRDEMRLKCKHLAKYKKNFAELLAKAREAKEQKKRLSNDLSSQALIIRDLEESTQSRDEFYKRELERYKSNERRMKNHIKNLECEYKRHVCELNEAAFLVSHLEQQLQLQEERYEGIVQKAKKFQQNGYRFCTCNSSKTLGEISKMSSLESDRN